MTTASDNPTRLIPITKWNQHHPWTSNGGLCHLRFHCEKNGFKNAFKKVSARVLVDEAEFFRCVEATDANRTA